MNTSSGGPILTALTIRIDRRTVLLSSLGTFIVFTAVPLLLPDLGIFVVARVITGALQGLFIASAFLIGPSVVPAKHAGRAMSIVLSGFAVSSAAGGPIGTLAGPGGALASSLPASAANAGIACGSVAGGVTIDLVDTRSVALTALVVAAAAAALAATSRSVRTPDVQLEPVPARVPEPV